MNEWIKATRAYFAGNFTVGVLKVLLIGWAIFIILMALLIDDLWILAGMLAYEVLP